MTFCTCPPTLSYFRLSLVSGSAGDKRKMRQPGPWERGARALFSNSGRESFCEFLRASAEEFPTWFVDVRIYPTTAVQRVNGLFIFLKLYLFCFFPSWNMGDQPKVLRRRKKKEVSEFSFLCCIFLAGYFPLEPTFTALGYLGSCRLM